MRTVYVFGNPLLKKDSIAVRVAEKLKPELPEVNFEFVENFGQIGIDSKGLKEVVIMDAVEGLVGIKVFSANDIHNFAKFRAVSAHDADLAMDLAVWKKIGKFREVRLRVIAISNEMEEEFAVNKVRELLSDADSL